MTSVDMVVDKNWWNLQNMQLLTCQLPLIPYFRECAFSVMRHVLPPSTSESESTARPLRLFIRRASTVLRDKSRRATCWICIFDQDQDFESKLSSNNDVLRRVEKSKVRSQS